MSNVKFQTIGKGVVHTKKNGEKCIHLIMDEAVLGKLAPQDWREGIYIFRRKPFLTPEYVVMAPIAEDNLDLVDDIQETLMRKN